MKIMAKTKLRILRWYQGVYVPPPKNEPGSGIVFIGVGFYIQPPLARFIRESIVFYLKHWQWVWSTIIALLSLWAAVLALK